MFSYQIFAVLVRNVSLQLVCVSNSVQQGSICVRFFGFLDQVLCSFNCILHLTIALRIAGGTCYMLSRSLSQEAFKLSRVKGWTIITQEFIRYAMGGEMLF